MLGQGLLVILVENDAHAPNDRHSSLLESNRTQELLGLHILRNNNLGGVAGGFNRGIELAIDLGAQWLTLLDQDSRLQPISFNRLLEPWGTGAMQLLVGPLICDARRNRKHGKQTYTGIDKFYCTRFLISSGTTFAAVDWPLLGPMFEWLVVDFVDHSWAFRAQIRGFQILQHPDVVLTQYFGKSHPNFLCRWIGMELYPPRRHFYQLRNLRWLVLQAYVPLDLRCKELLKMFIKPLLWLLFEPQRLHNLRAILAALHSSLPSSTDWR